MNNVGQYGLWREGEKEGSVDESCMPMVRTFHQRPQAWMINDLHIFLLRVAKLGLPHNNEGAKP